LGNGVGIQQIKHAKIILSTLDFQQPWQICELDQGAVAESVDDTGKIESSSKGSRGNTCELN
jgi:hypothetical protein